MGWITSARPSQQSNEDSLLPKTSSQPFKQTSIDVHQDYPFCSLGVSEADLPFTPSDEVNTRDGKSSSRLWIVIDDIVYDCTMFVNEHPGGDTVIKSFGGQACSWQFWRFHGKKELEQYARPLRVGRTCGVANRFQEPKKYVGLRGFGGEEW